MKARYPRFDLSTRTIHDATVLEWASLRLIQFGARLSAHWGYRGFGMCCRILQRLIPRRDLTVVLAHDTLFRFPLSDPYWSMLIGGAEVYEPEIEDFLKNISSEECALVDCGANYGYWSVLASGQRFGRQRVIAIEPSSSTFEVLSNNATLNDNRFACLKAAVGARSGVANLSGSKHEARTVSQKVTADSEHVRMLTLDSLLDDGHVARADKVIVKLDVEGLEIATLNGSRRLLECDCVVICEDHGSDRNHSVSRHILDRTQLKLFCYDVETERFLNITDVTALDHIKRFRNRGYNVFATASPYWEHRLRGLTAHRAEPGSSIGGTNETLIGSLARGLLLY